MHGFALLLHAMTADPHRAAREEPRMRQAREAADAAQAAHESVVAQRQAQALAAARAQVTDSWMPRLRGYPIDPAYARR